jgi:hypothetical protein
MEEVMKTFNYKKAIKEINESHDRYYTDDFKAGYWMGLDTALAIIKANIKEADYIIRKVKK